MAVWTANTLDRAQEWCGDLYSPGWPDNPNRCQSQNLIWERPTQTHCNECGRDWYYSCPDCGSDNGYFVDDEKTAYIAPFYFCIPEDTAKTYPNVSGEPTPMRSQKRFQPAPPGPVHQQQQQSRSYVSASPGPSRRWFAYLWAFAAFAVIAVFLVAFTDDSLADDAFEAILGVGGLVGVVLVWAMMRQSSKLAWFLIFAASILAVLLLLMVE